MMLSVIFIVICTNQGGDAQTIMENFLFKLALPNLATDERSALNASDSEHAVQETMKSLQRGKAPGRDGLPTEFHREFTDLLTEPYLNMLNHPFDTCIFPLSLREANNSLILKKGRKLHFL